MENIIDKIVDIDKRALDIKGKTEKMIKDNGKKLSRKLLEIEEKELKKAREIGDKEYNRILKQGQNECMEIKLATKKECESLDKNFLKIHKRLEKEIFNKLFK